MSDDRDLTTVHDVNIFGQVHLPDDIFTSQVIHLCHHISYQSMERLTATKLLVQDFESSGKGTFKILVLILIDSENHINCSTYYTYEL